MSLLLRLLKASYHRSFRRYQKPFSNQTDLLLRILKDNADSDYGKKYRFSDIRSAEQFRRQVPLVQYEELESWIERIKNGEQGVLTREPVTLLEPTGGSSGTEKLIPYTKQFKYDYQKSIEAWLYGLFTQYPELMGGKSYWMITPPLHEHRLTKGGLPIGFEEDADYLGAFGAFLMKQVMVRPNVYPGMSTRDFYNETLRALIEAEDLRLISVWNPSLLVLLVEHLWRDLPAVLKTLTLKRRLQVRKSLYAKDLRAVWPELRLISCWMDGKAAEEAHRLAEIFPQVTFQAKGLLATEGVITLPSARSAEGGMLPAYHSTYLEFLKDDVCYPLEELKLHERYELVITTSGGLYRYRLGDVVEVRAFYKNIALLGFVERTGTVDLAGEKLSAAFIEHQFKDVAPFYMFSPYGQGYRLYTDKPIDSREVEKTLCLNYHYALARTLGQLEAVQVFLIEGDASAQYLENLRAAGMRLGDIKSTHLSARQTWAFKGELLR